MYKGVYRCICIYIQYVEGCLYRCICIRPNSRDHESVPSNKESEVSLLTFTLVFVLSSDGHDLRKNNLRQNTSPRERYSFYSEGAPECSSRAGKKRNSFFFPNMKPFYAVQTRVLF